MPRSFKKLSLGSIADGAIVELFDYEWQRIVDDIADATKQPKAVRTLTIKLTVKPTEDRGSGDVEVDVSSKLAKTKAVSGTAYFTSENGRVASYVNDPKQEELISELEEEAADGR